VFLRKGYAATSMDEIAQEAEFTKPTLYQYFRDKEALYLAVALRCLRDMRAAVQTQRAEGESAWNALSRYCYSLLDFCESQPDRFKFIGALSLIRPDPAAPRPEREEVSAVNDAMFTGIADLIRRAQEEGSIPSSFDPFTMACQLLFLLTGFMNQLALTGATFVDHFRLDKSSFARSSLGLILGSIRSPAPPEAQA
jgi:AcrR family transcriptional regulator